MQVLDEKVHLPDGIPPVLPVHGSERLAGWLAPGSPIPVVLIANKTDLLQSGTESFETGARIEKVWQLWSVSLSWG